MKGFLLIVTAVVALTLCGMARANYQYADGFDDRFDRNVYHDRDDYQRFNEWWLQGDRNDLQYFDDHPFNRDLNDLRYFDTGVIV